MILSDNAISRSAPVNVICRGDDCEHVTQLQPAPVLLHGAPEMSWHSCAKSPIWPPALQANCILGRQTNIGNKKVFSELMRVNIANYPIQNHSVISRFDNQSVWKWRRGLFMRPMKYADPHRAYSRIWIQPFSILIEKFKCWIKPALGNYLNCVIRHVYMTLVNTVMLI